MNCGVCVCACEYLTELVDELVVFRAIDVARFHEAHVLLANGLLDSGRHFTAEQSVSLAVIQQLR